MHMFAIILFAAALSADGFGVGVSYGTKKISIPWGPLMVMCCCSMLAVAVAMVIGAQVSQYFSPVTGRTIGALVLVVIGLWFLIKALLDLKTGNDYANCDNSLLAVFRIKFLGIIVQILREPAKADIDESGEIGLTEAFLLGTALALDGLGAGIGASMAEFNLWVTVMMVGICEIVMVKAGMIIGVRLQESMLKNYAPVLSGTVLLLLGILHF
ncbi:MAG: sporulation membrane protein YtaF [Acidobacteriota bacterium]